jgi:hypothetical protein
MSISADDKSEKILRLLKEKACAKQATYRKTRLIFHEFKKVLQGMAQELNKEVREYDPQVTIDFQDRSEFEAYFKFSGDTLLFHMHTNIFSFEKHHNIWKQSYVKEKEVRAYCGVIHIYNFLSDTFKYNRINDPGFLIARVFVNLEGHFFTEGKGEFGFLFNDFSNSEIDASYIRKIIQTAIIHGLNFELLSPAHQEISMVSLYQVQEMGREMRIKTSKPLGYAIRGSKEEN